MSAKSYQRKTWREKLADSKGLPKIGKVERPDDDEMGHRNDGRARAVGSG